MSIAKGKWAQPGETAWCLLFGDQLLAEQKAELLRTKRLVIVTDEPPPIRFLSELLRGLSLSLSDQLCFRKDPFGTLDSEGDLTRISWWGRANTGASFSAICSTPPFARLIHEPREKAALWRVLCLALCDRSRSRI